MIWYQVAGDTFAGHTRLSARATRCPPNCAVRGAIQLLFEVRTGYGTNQNRKCEDLEFRIVQISEIRKHV